MAADHDNLSEFRARADIRPNLAFNNQSPFGLPSSASPFVAHLYPMVNAPRPLNPFLSHEPSLCQPPNPGSLLASVTGRADVLYNELYKNFLRSAAKSPSLKHPNSELSSNGPDSKNFPALLSEKNSGLKDSRQFNANQTRSFYEGLYTRLATSEYFQRFRADNPYRVPNSAGLAKDRSPWTTALGSRGGGFVPFPVTQSAFNKGGDFFRNAPRNLEAATNMSSKLARTRTSPPFHHHKYEAERSSESASSTASVNSHNVAGTAPDSDPKMTGTPPAPPLASTSEFVESPTSIRSEPMSPALSDRMKRKRRFTSTTDTCPICGITVRDSEMKQHFTQEMARLEKIAQDVYRNTKRHNATRKSSGSSFYKMTESSIQATTSSKKHDAPEEERESSNKRNRFKTFQKVRSNRLDRFNSKVGQCRESLWKTGLPSRIGPYGANEPKFDGAECPVCNSNLSHMTSHDQIADHVMRCADGAKRCDGENSAVKDEVIDVDADDGAFEEYEWCGETRVRATSLAHRELLANAPGFHIIKNADNDSDEDLNVETDETCEFGAVQYADCDLIPTCSSGEESPERNLEQLAHSERSDTPDSSVPLTHSSATIPGVGVARQSSPVVLEALRMKIHDLEGCSKSNRCLICMESFKNPLVSIQCWHVHCERCWLRALGVKKLCPQCNMITPASHLRKIYL